MKQLKSNKVLIDLTNVDWDLLRDQYRALIIATDEEETILRNKDRAQLLCGLMELMDYIRDEAGNQIGEKAVFG